MSQKGEKNNEIITFDLDNINVRNNEKKKEINIDEILEKENELLKKNKLIEKKEKRKELKKNEEKQEEKIINLDEDKVEKINEAISQDVRDTSRRIYLNKRVNQQLELFKRRIIDEYNIFKDVKLTKEEINNNKLNNVIYNLINKSYNTNKIEKEKESKNTKKDKKEELENIDLVQRYTFKREDTEFNPKKIKDKKTKRNKTNDFNETSESLWEKEQRKKQHKNMVVQKNSIIMTNII